MFLIFQKLRCIVLGLTNHPMSKTAVFTSTSLTHKKHDGKVSVLRQLSEAEIGEDFADNPMYECESEQGKFNAFADELTLIA